MGTDVSIYQNLLRPPKTMAEYDHDNLLAQQGRQQLQIGQQGIDKYNRDLQDQNTLRETAKSFGTDQTANYNRLLQTGNLAAAQNYQKAGLEARKMGAETDEKVSQTLKHRSETAGLDLNQQILRRDQHLQQLASVNTLQDAQQWITDGVKSGELPFDKAAQIFQGLQQNPASLSQWKQQAQASGTSLMEQLKQQQNERDFALKANNELMMPNGQGGYQQNAPLIAAKNQIAKSGASNVSVKVDNKYGEGVAKEVGPMLKSSYDNAIGAQASIGTADSLIGAIDSGKVFTGPGATLRLKGAQVAQALGVGGRDDAEKIANTRAAIQGLAQTTLTARKQMSGQGQISDNEGKLLERAASGDIEDMTAAEIKQIANVNKRLAQRQVKMHDEFVKKIQGQPSTAGIANMFELPSSGDSVPSVPVNRPPLSSFSK